MSFILPCPTREHWWLQLVSFQRGKLRLSELLPGLVSRGQDLAPSRVGPRLLQPLAGQTTKSLIRKPELQTDYSRAGCHRSWFLFASLGNARSFNTQQGRPHPGHRDPQQILDIHKMNQCPMDQGQSSDFPECHLAFPGQRSLTPALQQFIHVLRRDRTNSL